MGLWESEISELKALNATLAAENMRLREKVRLLETPSLPPEPATPNPQDGAESRDESHHTRLLDLEAKMVKTIGVLSDLQKKLNPLHHAPIDP